MKKCVYKEIPENADYELEMSILTENAAQGFKVLEENIPEIREIFEVQLDKPGHIYRAFAVEEILKYLYSHRVEKFESSQDKNSVYWEYSYARTIYELADIIKAANDGDEKAFDEAMKVLPWGDSNTGDQVSWNTARFAYGIMSDEAREKFGPIFYRYIEKSNMGRENTSRKISNMAELEFLPDLVEYNLVTEKEIKSTKQPAQPGAGE